MTAITSSMSSLVAANQSAQDAMSTILTDWDDLIGKMNTVLSDLDKAENPTQKVHDYMSDLKDATTSWAALSTYCTNMQNTTITVAPAQAMPPAA